MELGRKYKCQVWSSVVTIVLIKIKNCTIAEGLCDPYVRFRYVSNSFVASAPQTGGRDKISERTVKYLNIYLFYFNYFFKVWVQRL